MPLSNGLAVCYVNSWLTGHRMVSLPFSDHCEPITEQAAELDALLSALQRELREEDLQYVEIRPVRNVDNFASFSTASHSYCFHQLDLSLDTETLFRNCHKDSTQRKIRRAEREELTYEDGRSQSLLATFYQLLLLTRRRHGVPPQPKRWFQNLIDCFGEALKIRVASKNSQALAAILTLRFKDTLVYKYGCSDDRFHHLGGMHLLFWKAIQEAKGDGLTVLDLGRSDLENTGLVTFKDRWGSTRSVLTYYRLSASQHPRKSLRTPGTGWKRRSAGLVLSYLPDQVFCSVGNLLYAHLG